MKLTPKYLLSVFVFVLLCAFFVIPASAATDDGTGMFVGGVAVTDENRSDILGDGTASFDPETLTLTLKNYKAEGVVRTDDGGKASENALSVYTGVGSSAITVKITGDCYFPGGVVNVIGKIVVEDAKVTFGPSVPTCLFARNGAIDIVDSEIKMQGVNFLSPIFGAGNMSIGFFASEIGAKNSRFTLDIDSCEAYNLNRIDALFCAVETAVFDGCRFKVDTPFPVFRTLFQAYNDSLMFHDCRLNLSGQMYCFLAGGNPEAEEEDLPSDPKKGAVWLDSCRVKVKNSYYLLGGSTFQIHNSKIKASLYRGGCIMAGKNENYHNLFKDSRITFKMLSLEDMKKGIWKPYWDAMTEQDQAVYGSFTAFALASEQSEAEHPTDTFGVFVQNGTTYFETSRITVKGFDYGFFALGKSIVKCMEGAYLHLAAEHSAFVLFSIYDDPFQHDIDVSFGANEGSELSLPMGTDTQAVGTRLYGIVKKGERLILSEEKAFSSVGEVLSVAEGNLQEIKLLSEGAYNPATVGVLVGAGVTVVLLGAIYLLFVYKKHPKQQDEPQS